MCRKENIKNMIDLSALKLVKAEMKHLERVLEMSEGIYEGQDYLGHVYISWIKEENANSDTRRNVVLVDGDGVVMGYQSFMFQVRKQFLG